ncbi:hypothetical protein Z517_07504 [Fonsecaea pedrosoi CBS 271.37]|uniref:Uncharacterized protein n=1 Tax=Fonsecaea pedrosoi CBS 271.37 TaxID=1442368 RepID=A0A0D2ETW2_9EURO|nr:uncharacterized protein Z517_07504 [Fonsecaea pedrosoi CBS 271.37]KIW77672.1 hypothetical protein Z517_07504 [Fonsecaea pedrosoi CBS 271.37]
MAFFHHSHESEEETSDRRRSSSNSLRDLQARAYAKWVVAGTVKKSSNQHAGFEAERSRRHFWQEEAARFGIVMRT